MKKYLQLILCGLSLSSCNKTNQNQELVFKEQPAIVSKNLSSIPYKNVSYKLEDLCDTELYEKNIILDVYIEDSKILWDYHKYKDEIFQYVKDFFKENQINCNIVYSNSHFQKFNSNNEFGLEVWDDKKDIEDRYFQLVTETDEIPKDNPLKFAAKGYAATKAGIALVNGGWEEFRDDMKTGELTIEEIEKQFPEQYKELTVKEYQFKNNMAANICHELGHCMGLFHIKTFDPVLVDLYYKDVPNIMSYCNMKVKKGYSIGYALNPLQKKLIHSFIAGNNAYKAFVDSHREMDFYIENIREKNHVTSSSP